MPIVNPGTSPAVPGITTIASVSVFSDVRALAAGIYPVLQVLGGITVGDGKDGVFYWSALSVAADDGFAVLAPSAGGAGRWIRIYGAVVQSGTGALTRTVSAALAATVRTGDYDTAGHFNTAQAALTETIGIKQIRLGTGVDDGIVLPSAGTSPFQISAGSGTFNGTIDPQLHIAYNYQRANTSDATLLLSMEGHYYDLIGRYMEVNLDFGSDDGLISKRYLGFQVHRTTGAASWAVIGNTIRLESVVNNGEIIFTTALGKIARSVADGNLTTAATAKTGLFLSNSSAGASNLSATIQFDVGGGQGGAKIYTESNGGSGGILHFATDTTGGVITDRWKIDASGSLVATGAGGIAFGDGTVGSPSLVLGSVTGSGFYKGGFGSISYSNGGTEAIALAGGIGLGSASVLQWSSTAAASGSADVVFTRTGTSTLSLNCVLNVASATATPAAGSTAARLVFGTTAGFGIYYGSGAPTVSAAKGSLYLRSDGSGTTDRAYIATNGSGTWTAITTVA